MQGRVLRVAQQVTIIGSVQEVDVCKKVGTRGSVLGGSWDLVSRVISTLNGVISIYKYSYLNYDPLSTA